MRIFRHRPLFLLCFGFTLASLAGFFLSPLWAAVMGGCFLVGTVIYCIWRVWRRDSFRAILGGVLGLLVSVGLLCSQLWLYGGSAAALNALTGETVTVTGTVTDRRGSGGYMTAYTVELTSVGDTPTDGRALLTCHYVSDLQPGYAVEMEVTVISLDEAAGDGYDATALMGDGYVTGLLSESEETVTVTDEDEGSLSVKAGRLRRALAARLNRFADGAEGLPSALLLGDKTALPDSVRRDFARAGVSHLLAISGLHMTLLFGLLEGFLRLLRIPKRGRAVLLSLSALGYLILLGFPPSATRAAVMLGAVYLSRLFSAKADPLTSLGLAGAVILAATPYAACDAGFWMSYLATLGLVTVMPLFHARARQTGADASLFRRLWAGIRKALAGIVVGMVAMSFTLFVVAVVIGELGILSPVSTLLLTPLCGCVLVLSLAALPLGGSAVGALLCRLIEALCGVMTRLAAWMGEPSWAVVSLRHSAVAPVALCMLVGVLILLTVSLPQGSNGRWFCPSWRAGSPSAGCWVFTPCWRTGR